MIITNVDILITARLQLQLVCTHDAYNKLQFIIVIINSPHYKRSSRYKLRHSLTINKPAIPLLQKSPRKQPIHLLKQLVVNHFIVTFSPQCKSDNIARQVVEKR